MQNQTFGIRCDMETARVTPKVNDLEITVKTLVFDDSSWSSFSIYKFYPMAASKRAQRTPYLRTCS